MRVGGAAGPRAGRAVLGRALLVPLLTIVALALATPALADEPPWQPDEPYALTEDREFVIEDESRCEPGRSWTWEDGSNAVGLLLIPCSGTDAAAAAAAAQVLFTSDHPDQRVLDVERVTFSDGLALRVWAQDDRVVVVGTGVADGDRDAAFALGAEVAPAVAASLPGEPVAPSADSGAIQGALVLVPISAYLLLVLPARGVVALLRPRYLATSADPRWRDITPAVGVVRARRRWRRLSRWMIGIGAVLVVSGTANLVYTAEDRVGSVTRLTLGIGLTVGGVLLRRRMPLHAVERAERPPSGHGPRVWVGNVLSGVAHVLAVVIGLLAVLSALVAAVLPPSQRALTPAEILASGPEASRAALVTAGVLIRDVLPLFVLGVLALLTVVAGVDAVGRRLRAASLREVLDADPRPPILYLRSFDEDRLTLPATLHRKGLIAALNVVRRRRFEEAVVVQLQRAGPVVAIAPPGTRLPRIGAARASYGHDEWQGEVEQLADRAAVVVLSATPDSVREGFGWEIDLVAHRLDHHRVMVVVGPWRRQLARRWEAFRSYVATLPFFAPLATAALPDGLLVAAHSDRWGWAAWGATKRTDFSYAVAIDHALHAWGPEIGFRGADDVASESPDPSGA